MKNLTVLIAVLLFATSITTASLTFYTDPFEFEGLYPQLTAEDYSATLVPANSSLDAFGPLNSSTNNALFSPGGIADGLSFDNLEGDNNVVFVPPFAGVINIAVGPNLAESSSEYSFSVPVNAFSVEIVMPFSSGSFIDIEVFGPSGSLGTTTVIGIIYGTFCGVYSDSDNIVRIEFTEHDNYGELFSNVQFGEVVSALENSTWGNIKISF